MSRETRLLLATIAVAVGMLLLLSRFRFPREVSGDEPVAQPAAAPLERLAAGATYDELASIMADLESRLAPRVAVLRVAPARPGGPYVVAPRIAPGRSVVVLGPRETLEADGAQMGQIVERDRIREIAVLASDGGPDSPVTPIAGGRRPGPRYVAVMEGSARGPVIRPVYVGRMDLIDDPRRSGQALSVASTAQALPRGAAVFSLAGNLIGLVVESGTTTTLVGSDVLRTMAEGAQPSESTGDIAVEVQTLSAALSRATGASTGVVVSSVHPAGPSAAALLPGDVITEINGSPVRSPAEYQQAIQGQASGSEVSVKAIRMREPVEVRIVARSSSDNPLPRPPADEAGFVLRTVPRVGALVEAVVFDSPAAHAGVTTGDLIVRANALTPPSAETLTRAFRDLKPGTAMLLTVRRGTSQVVLAIEKAGR